VLHHAQEKRRPFGGITWNPVDPARAARLMQTARRAREGVVVG
jgi:hypothetical protein